MKIVIYSAVIILIILLTYMIFTYESFDSYDNHYRKAKKLFPGITELDMQYKWRMKNKDGYQLYDIIYENLDHLDYIDNKAINDNNIEVISENVVVPFGENLIHMSQKKYY